MQTRLVSRESRHLRPYRVHPSPCRYRHLHAFALSETQGSQARPWSPHVPVLNSSAGSCQHCAEPCRLRAKPRPEVACSALASALPVHVGAFRRASGPFQGTQVARRRRASAGGSRRTPYRIQQTGCSSGMIGPRVTSISAQLRRSCPCPNRTSPGAWSRR